MPDAIIQRLDNARDPKEEGIKICIEHLEEMANIDGISGVHLMSPINYSCIPDVVRELSFRA